VIDAGELLVRREGHVVHLTLNRPERRNALTPELIEALLAELEQIGNDAEVRVVVLTGAGTSFCAGFDVEHLRSPGGGTGNERDLVEALCSRVRTLRQPVIASVNGAALGAGCDLAVSCDIRLASTEARLGMPPARLGLLYSLGGILRLVSVAGAAVAKEMFLSAEPIDAERAERLGFVAGVVAPERLAEETERYAAALAANAPLSVQAAKLVLNLVADGTPLPAEALAAIDEASRCVWASEDSKEGPRAFRERREPRFEGR
jgi:enoyl-CoA hydratase/carnithine racemase